MVYVIVRPLAARRTYCQPLLIEINTTLEFIPRYESDAPFPLHNGAVAVRATQYIYWANLTQKKKRRRV